MQIERIGPSKNLPVKVVQLQRWSTLTFRSGPTEVQNVPLILRVTTTSKMADDVSVCTLRTTELSTLLTHIRVKQSQMWDTISGNMDTSSHCDMLTDFQCYLEPHSQTKALCISRNSAMSILI